MGKRRAATVSSIGVAFIMERFYKIRRKITAFLLSLSLLTAYAYTEGADAAAPVIAQLLEHMPTTDSAVYQLNDEELTDILGAAADNSINLFELIDCCYRYLAPRNMRIALSGDSLRRLKSSFNYGGHPIDSLLPIDKLVKAETGVCFTGDQKAFDIYLDSSYSVYIDIATALYEPRCGFKTLEPLNFSEPYGMRIKKWGIVKKIKKIHLYSPGSAAVYVKGFYKPKRWGLPVVTRL